MRAFRWARNFCITVPVYGNKVRRSIDVVANPCIPSSLFKGSDVPIGLVKDTNKGGIEFVSRWIGEIEKYSKNPPRQQV